MLYTYETKKQLSKRYAVSISTVDNRQKEIKKLIGKRYPEEAYLDNGRIHRIRSDVFDDIMIYGDRIAAGVAPEFGGRD